MRRAALDVVPDSVRAGAIVALAYPGTVELVRRALPIAWSILEERLGPAALRAEGHPLVFQLVRTSGVGETTGARAASRSPPAIRFGLANGSVMTEDEFTTRDQRSVLVDKLVELLAAEIWTSDGERFGHWLTAGEWAPMMVHDQIWAAAYVELVTAPSQAVARCYQGDLDWCRSALGLDAGRSDPFQWYSPDERRRLVSAMRISRIPGLELRDAYAHCVNARRQLSCDSVVRARAMDVPPPLPNSVRASLVAMAFELGGAGAPARLLGARDTSVELRLAVAAGTSSDSLLSAWRRRVLAANSPSLAMSALAALSVFIWCAIGLGFAMRSARWR